MRSEYAEKAFVISILVGGAAVFEQEQEVAPAAGDGGGVELEGGGGEAEGGRPPGERAAVGGGRADAGLVRGDRRGVRVGREQEGPGLVEEGDRAGGRPDGAEGFRGGDLGHAREVGPEDAARVRRVPQQRDGGCFGGVGDAVAVGVGRLGGEGKGKKNENCGGYGRMPDKIRV